MVFTGLAGVYSGKASAQAAPPNLSLIGKCGTSDSQYSVLLNQVSPDAQLYIKLNNVNEHSSSVTVYFQSFSDSQCHLIGTNSPSYGGWSKVGDYNLDTTHGGSFVVAGNGLGALPYQAVASLLILPNPAVCTPSANCQVTYQGYKGVLSPQIISGATDEVAVYLASPLSGVDYNKVTYYSDNQFLYASTRLQPINRGYLDGGLHNISIQVDLSDQQTLTINQTINMGTDYTGTLFIKSLIYRTRNKALVFIIPTLVFVIILELLWIARLVYKHRLFKVEHGLNQLSKHGKDDKTDPTDNVISG